MTVYAILCCFKMEDCINSIPQKGQPEKVTACDKRWIWWDIQKYPKASAPRLTTLLCERKGEIISVATECRAIKRMGYNVCTARWKLYISPVKVKKHLEFVSKYQFAVETFYYDVIFTDESKYNLFDSDGKVKVWR